MVGRPSRFHFGDGPFSVAFAVGFGEGKFLQQADVVMFHVPMDSEIIDRLRTKL